MNILERTLKPILFFATWVLFFGTPDLAGAETEWIELETRYTIIRYTSVDTLERFHKSIHYGHGWWSTTASFAKFTQDENRKIALMKTDAIFERVQEILDMKKKFKKVFIHLYPDSQALEAAFVAYYKQDCRFRAWYEYQTNTVSLNVEDCHAGLLAHELAHSIIDHFLQVRPPQNTAEILSRYVDTHL